MRMDHEPDGLRAPSMASVGYLLGGLSLLALFVLLHHPVGHGREPADVLGSIRAQAGIDQVVHAALSIIFGILAAVMFLFASRLGVWRLPVLLGLVAFSSALVLTVLAAMTDGFIIPALASRCGDKASSNCIAETLTLLRRSGLQVEFLTRFSFVGIAVAVIAWSGALLFTRGVPRWAGLVGLASGGCQLMALWFVSDRLRPRTLMVILAAQVAWYLLVAVMMVRGRGPFGCSSAVDD